jgi:hypothetical protein
VQGLVKSVKDRITRFTELVREQSSTIVFSILSLYSLFNLLFVDQAERLSDHAIAIMLFISMLFAFLSYLTTFQKQQIERKEVPEKVKEKVSLSSTNECLNVNLRKQLAREH